jgi:FMN phosphatase YigB (HAD superfamily)
VDWALPPEHVDLVSTDVFDTLLLRTWRSESARILAGERAFARVLEARGHRLAVDLLVGSRLEAQRLAFRALNVGADKGEVRLADIVARQLRVLGLPEELAPERLQIELRIEKRSLRRNEALADKLRMLRRSGRRVVAISDTTLDAASLRDLIGHFYEPNLLDAVYSSADEGATKREGTLFLSVARQEGTVPGRMLHIGDDRLADVQVPSRLGLTTLHAPRGTQGRYIRALNGASVKLGRVVRIKARHPRPPVPASNGAWSFGQEVFGPILTQFCMLIWLYASQAETSEPTALLFCARGGIGIREAFERVLVKLALPLLARRETIMISRLIAARGALLARSPAALEELGREFRGATSAALAQALGGRAYQLPAPWHEPFRRDSFEALLFGRSGAALRSDIEEQNRLFTRHFKQLAGDASRLILCDTGLYGSTQRLLAGGFPDLSIESLLFARSNYKRHSEDHFGRVTGLFVEQSHYNPFDSRTCVLRFWHLIESLFEPALPSVRWFEEDGNGDVVSNAGEIRFGAVDPAAQNALLAGALAYIDALPARGAGATALWEAEAAWPRLARAITRPREADARALDVGMRSVDFGRPEGVPVVRPGAGAPLPQKLVALRGQLWREGAIAREFPRLKHALWPMLGSIQTMRGVLDRLQR